MIPNLQLRVSQHLALTPQLQQSIRLLQLSTLEMAAEVEQMLDENPFLERDPGTAEREEFGLETADAPVQDGGVFGRQAQAQRLLVQVRGQRLVRGAALARVQLGVCRAGVRGLAGAPFTVVGGQLAVTFTVPVLRRVGFKSGFRAFTVCVGCFRFSSTWAGIAGGCQALRVGRGQGGIAVVGLVLALQEGVVLQHLLDFARQLQRGQLQQANRLLQLRRERQVLRGAQRQAGFHRRRWGAPRWPARPREADVPGETGERGGVISPPPGRPKAARAPSGGSAPCEAGERGGVIT